MGKSKLEGKMHEEAALLVAEMDSHSEQPFDPKGIIASHSANIICSMVFGMNFKHDDKRFLDMLARFDENLRYCVTLFSPLYTFRFSVLSIFFTQSDSYILKI